MDKLNIVIAGCGWLGRQIGEALINEGHHVFGSYRSSETRNKIESAGIQPISLSQDQSALNKTNVLIITIPPGREGEINHYAENLTEIVSLFPSDVKVIFTSSTGIYPKGEGRYTEEYDFDEAEKETKLYQAEKVLKEILHERLVILRLGGLIGPDRHPVYSLNGRKMPTDGLAPINLIDSRDIVRLIDMIIKNEIYDDLFNVCFPVLMTKKDYYEIMADRLGLERPEYVGKADSIRLIDSSKLVRHYDFRFHYPITDYTSAQ